MSVPISETIVMLTAIYHMLKQGSYLKTSAATTSIAGPPNSKKRRLVKRLADLGYAAELTPLPPPLDPCLWPRRGSVLYCFL